MMPCVSIRSRRPRRPRRARRVATHVIDRLLDEHLAGERVVGRDDHAGSKKRSGAPGTIVSPPDAASPSPASDPANASVDSETRRIGGRRRRTAAADQHHRHGYETGHRARQYSGDVPRASPSCVPTAAGTNTLPVRAVASIET